MDIWAGSFTIDFDRRPRMSAFIVGAVAAGLYMWYQQSHKPKSLDIREEHASLFRKKTPKLMTTSIYTSEQPILEAPRLGAPDIAPMHQKFVGMEMEELRKNTEFYNSITARWHNQYGYNKYI